MKNLYPILLMLAIMLSSCSGDDSSNQVQNNNPETVTPVVTDSTATDTTNTPAVSIKVSKIKVTYIGDSLWDNTTNFVYDGDKLISEHKIGGDGVDFKLDYFYNGNKVDHINKYDNGSFLLTYNFTYSGNNITQIQSVGTNNIYNFTSIYNYNQNNQIITSTIYNNDNSSQGTFTYTWDANGNMVDASTNNTLGQTANASYEYDDKINPFKNYRLCYPENSISVKCTNNIKKKISAQNGSVSMWEYQYNDLGYPVKSKTISYQGTEIITEYFYTEN